MPPANDSTTLKIRKVAVAELKPDPANARVHGDANLTAIEASLRRFGQRKPLVVDEELTVVSGNGTLEVIRDRLGWAQCWVSVFPGTAAEARAYAIADNHTGELAEWDDRVLTDTLLSLQRQDEALFAATGYDTFDLDELVAAADTTTELLAAATATPGTTPGETAELELPETPQRGFRPASATPGPGPAAPETRTLTFEMTADVFNWAVEVLGKVRDDSELDTTGEALVAILQEYTDVPMPDGQPEAQ